MASVAELCVAQTGLEKASKALTKALKLKNISDPSKMSSAERQKLGDVMVRVVELFTEICPLFECGGLLDCAVRKIDQILSCGVFASSISFDSALGDSIFPLDSSSTYEAPLPDDDDTAIADDLDLSSLCRV